MTTPAFYTKSGALTAYALGCGYVEQFNMTRHSVNLSVSLWHEHDCYHVRAHEFDGRGRLEWQAFGGRLGEARKAFKRMCKQYTIE